jgi:hypothetical protein
MNSSSRIPFLFLALFAGIFLPAGCGQNQRQPSEPAQPRQHQHDPLFGGKLVELGDHEYNIEFVHDPENQRMEAYILDGHASNFIRIPAQSFEVIAKIPGEPGQTLVFEAVTRTETGETVGNTALFQAEADWLGRVNSFDGILKEITIRGKQYQGIAFTFPK